jgi:adenylate kinase
VRIVMLGPPGAGKGTQAALLSERLGLPHISTGDILRQAVAAGTPLGREARRHMDAGGLVPDEVIIGIVEERLRAADVAGGFILDGFPRTVAQAEALDALLARGGQRLSAVLQIAVPPADLVRRLSGRRVCQECGAMFHAALDAAAGQDRCGRCGGALYQRADDREATIIQRMEVYERETAPLEEHYRRAGLLRRIDGTGGRDEVFQRVAAGVR